MLRGEQRVEADQFRKLFPVRPRRFVFAPGAVRDSEVCQVTCMFEKFCKLAHVVVCTEAGLGEQSGTPVRLRACSGS